MQPMIDIIRSNGWLTADVLREGLARGWASKRDVVDFALDRLGAGHDGPEVMSLLDAEQLDLATLQALLQRSQNTDTPASVKSPLSPWMYATLVQITEGRGGEDEKLDQLEDLYASFGYPEQLRECSRYYVPTHDQQLSVGEHTESPLLAMARLLETLKKELSGEA